jgi:hypothetical protein
MALLTILLIVGVSWTGAPLAGASGTYQVVNADGGVYYRNSPAWEDTDRIVGVGVYTGDTVELICGTWGEAVGPNANRRWHLVRNLSRAVGEGWVPDRMLTTPNNANELTPGEAECGSSPATPPPAPSGHSVFYSGQGAAGVDYAAPFADVMLSENGTRDLADWAAGDCSPVQADDAAIGATTLAGHSLGRLGPIYALQNSQVRNTVRYVLMFDPGAIETFGCDRAAGASQVLSSWLASNSANRLVIMAGEFTAPDAHRSIQDVYFAPAIRDTNQAGQVLVCNVENDGQPWSHDDVVRGYAWMIDQPAPSSCPSGFLGWNP